MKKTVSLLYAASLLLTAMCGCSPIAGTNAESSIDIRAVISGADRAEEKKYAEEIARTIEEYKNSINSLTAGYDNGTLTYTEYYDGIDRLTAPVIRGVHGEAFFESLNYNRYSSSLYGGEIISHHTDRGKDVTSGYRYSVFCNFPSESELELICELTDRNLTDDEYAEKKEEFCERMTDPASIFYCYISDDEKEREYHSITNDHIVFSMFAFDSLCALSDEDLKGISGMSDAEVSDLLYRGDPAADRMKKLILNKNETSQLAEKAAELYLTVREDYPDITIEQQKRIFLLRMTGNTMCGYFGSKAFFEYLEAKYSSAESISSDKLTLETAREIIAESKGKNDPVGAALQKFLEIQPYPDKHILPPDAAALRMLVSMNSIYETIDSYYEFISQNEDGTTDSIVVYDEKGIVYHRYDKSNDLVEEKILLVDFDKAK